MPELPEVETMVQDLRERIVGRRIEAVDVYWPRTVGHPSPEQLGAGIQGRSIETITRRGKFALLRLDDSAGTLGVHRGMTGTLLHRPSGASEDRFVRARMHLSDGSELRFDDARKFGRWYWQRQRDEWMAPWEKLGVEPLSDEFSASRLRDVLAGRRAAIKTSLLNQRVLAGLGNIYADEALFLAGIHPQRAAGTLKKGELSRLREAIRNILLDSISRRGTTFSNYRDIDGEPGSNQHGLRVFQRHSQPCYRCGRPITRIVLGGRGTHFCPKCQR